jgi:hypothetical protein
MPKPTIVYCLIPLLVALMIASSCDTSDHATPLPDRNATSATLAVPNSSILPSPLPCHTEHARLALGPALLPNGTIDAPPNSELAFRAIVVVDQIKADIRDGRNGQQFNRRELATYAENLRQYEQAGEYRDLPKGTAVELLGMRTIAGAGAALVQVSSLKKNGQPLIGWIYQSQLE